MKKFILLTLLAVMTLGAAAQVRTSRTFTRHKSSTTWYARAGMNFSTISNIPEDIKEESKFDGTVGFDVDFGFQKPFGSSNVYWGMELGVGSRGVKTSDTDPDNDVTYKVSAYGVTYSPLTLGYKYAFTDNFKLDGHLGGFLAYDFAYGGDGELDKAFDAGMQVGVGVWFDRVNLDFTYQAGFCNTCEGPYEDFCKIGKFMIRLGYAF